MAKTKGKARLTSAQLAAKMARNAKDRARRRQLNEPQRQSHDFVRQTLAPVIALANASHTSAEVQLTDHQAREGAVNIVSTLGGYATKDVQIVNGPSSATPSFHINELDGRLQGKWKPRDVGHQEMSHGIATAERLLLASGAKWDGSLIASDLRGLRPLTLTSIDQKGGVSIATTFRGNLSQLVGLAVGQCHAEPYRKIVASYLSRCDHPACEKWYFAEKRKVSSKKERGHRRHCCERCGTSHRQLRLSPDYEQRRREGQYPKVPCERCS